MDLLVDVAMDHIVADLPCLAACACQSMDLPRIIHSHSIPLMDIPTLLILHVVAVEMFVPNNWIVLALAT